MEDIVVYNPDIKTRRLLGNMLQELGQLGSTDTVGAIHNELARGSPSAQGSNKGFTELLIISSLAGLSVAVDGAFCVDTAREVVELRGSKDLVVSVRGIGSVESISESGDEAVARRTSIPSENDLAGRVQVDLEKFREPLVLGNKCLVRGGIDELSGVGFPILLKHLTHGVDDLDSIVGGGIVAGGDHDTDGLAAELSAAKRGKETDAEGDAVEEIGLHTETGSAIFVESALGEGDDGVPFGGGNNLFIHFEDVDGTDRAPLPWKEEKKRVKGSGLCL